MRKLVLVFFLVVGCILGQPTPTTTVYTKAMEDIDTEPATSALLPNVGQSGHTIVVYLKDNPPNVCTFPLASGLDVRLQVSYDNIQWFSAVLNQITAPSFEVGPPLIVFATGSTGGAFPYLRILVADTDVVNCLTDVYYSGYPGAQNSINSIGVREGTGADNRPNTAVGRMLNDEGGATELVVYPSLFDGTAWDRLLDCEDTVAVSVGAATTLELVALSASTSIRICSLDVSLAAAGTVKLVSGTGANCAVGQADLTGAFTLGQGIPLHIGQNIGRAIVGLDSEAVCLTTTGGGATAQGVLTYSQY